MKLVLALVLLVLLLAAGLYVHHVMDHEEPSPSAAPLPATSSGDAPSLEGRAPVSLDERLRRIEERLGAQEVELARLRAALPRPGVVDPNALRDILPPGEGDYDEETLTALEGHMREIERRRRASAQLVLVERNIDRIDLRLGEDERKTVVDAVLAFRTRTATFWQDMAARGITDREDQLAELDKLRNETIRTLRAVIPDQDMPKAIHALLGAGAANIHPGGSSAPSLTR